jgi:hypothetical protein
MYDYHYKTKGVFDICESYNEIAGTAFRFEAEGHPDIWIYIEGTELKIHYVELKLLSDCLVAHYKCRKVTHGFSSFEWNKLGMALARVYLANKK